MDKLLTGQIYHAYHDKEYYSIFLPKSGYLVFKLISGFKLNSGDSISFYDKWGANTMLHIKSGDWFSVNVVAIGVSSKEVETYNRDFKL